MGSVGPVVVDSWGGGSAHSLLNRNFLVHGGSSLSVLLHDRPTAPPKCHVSLAGTAPVAAEWRKMALGCSLCFRFIVTNSYTHTRVHIQTHTHTDTYTRIRIVSLSFRSWYSIIRSILIKFHCELVLLASDFVVTIRNNTRWPTTHVYRALVRLYAYFCR